MTGPDMTKHAFLALPPPDSEARASGTQAVMGAQEGTAMKGIPPHEIFSLPEMLPMARHSGCPSCGYDLMGLNGQHGSVTCVMHSGRILAISTYRCPECGRLARVPQGYVQPLCDGLLPVSAQRKARERLGHVMPVVIGVCAGLTVVLLLWILATAV
jgi:hypothetical protein